MAAYTELWKKIVYVLNRGGRFEDFERGWKGEHVAAEPGSIVASEEEWQENLIASAQLTYQPKGIMAFYAENVAKAKNSMTGANFSGVAHWEPPADLLGKELPESDGEFSLISYKEVGQGHSRTVGGYWNLSTFPESLLYINKADADNLKIKDGDRIRLTSRTNPGTVDLGNGEEAEMVARAKPIQGIRPGVLALAGAYGHWAWGASDVEVDGETVAGDSRRAKGMHPNLVVAFDPQVANVITVEPVAGNAASYDARVSLKKA